MAKGNLTKYLNEFQALYSKLLKQGKDLYVFGDDPVFVIGLKKRKREKVNTLYHEEFKLMSEDINDYKKIFPNTKRSDEEILNIVIKPYTKISQFECLSLKGLGKILKGKPARVYEMDIDMI